MQEKSPLTKNRTKTKPVPSAGSALMLLCMCALQRRLDRPAIGLYNLNASEFREPFHVHFSQGRGR